jgi:hypothetical protein
VDDKGQRDGIEIHPSIYIHTYSHARAAMQLANAEEEGGAGGKDGGDNEGLGTPDILNKLYQDIERDFQVGVLCMDGCRGTSGDAAN